MKFDLRDVLAGSAVAVVGLYFAIKAQDYRFGTVHSMGPGFFPLVLGWMTVGIGAWIAVPAFFRGYQRIGFEPRALVAILAGVAAFGFTLRHLGLVPAVFATIVLAAAGDRTARPWSTIILGAFVAAAAWLVFVRGLGLPMPAFRRVF